MATGKPKRLTPTIETLRVLFAKSGNQCAFPGCKSPLFDDENNFIVNVCHIEAALPKGERFNPQQSNEDRRKFENLVLFCYPHHIKTNNTDQYTVEVLKEIKANNEAQFTTPTEFEEGLIQSVYDQLQSALKVLLQSTSGSIHKWMLILI